MANLKETNTWEAGIYQLETTDPVVGGVDGISNKQAKQLANRTLYLKTELTKAQGSINTKLGLTAKAADSDKLDGLDSSAFSRSNHTHDTEYLGKTAKAADSDKLDGLDSLAFSRSDHNHDDIYVKQNNTLPTGDVTAKAFWENVPAGVYVAWGEGYTNKPGAGSNDWVMVLGSHQRSRLNKMVVWFNSSDFTVWQGVVSSNPTVNFVPFNYEALESSKLPNGNTKTSNYWAGVKPGLYYAGASDAGVTNSPSASGVYHVTTCGNAPTQKVILFLSSADDAKAYKIAFNGAGQTKEWVEVSTPQGTKQANGYVILQNGLIVQWMSSETKSGTFNFPIAFPNQCFQIVASLSVVSSNNLPNQHIGATVVNNSQFKITQGLDLVSPWRMIAVGH